MVASRVHRLIGSPRRMRSWRQRNRVCLGDRARLRLASRTSACNMRSNTTRVGVIRMAKATATKETATAPAKKSAGAVLTTTEIGEHLASTFDIPKSHAKIYLTEAVALMAKSPQEGQQGPYRGARRVPGQEARRPQGPQPEHRRSHQDQGLEARRLRRRPRPEGQALESRGAQTISRQRAGNAGRDVSGNLTARTMAVSGLAAKSASAISWR